LEIIYNKAIRDKIPEIIRNSGKECEVKTISDTEFLFALEKKLHEEIAEYDESKSVEELVDLLEVIYRIAELHKVDANKVELMRKQKNEERGKFSKNLYLIKTCSVSE
jgi:predicted house-cleaning noncanonical NTP pyrophosphatase (MazG superfamily)